MTKLLDKIPRLAEAMDKNGRCPLYSAAFKGCRDAAELLIKKVKSQMVKAYRYTYDPSEIWFSRNLNLIAIEIWTNIIFLT